MLQLGEAGGPPTVNHLSQFVEGVLKIDSKKRAASRKKAVKKRAKGKSNRNNQAKG